MGAWTVPGTAGPPAAVSVTPSSGTGANQTFALEYYDTNGASSLQAVYAWFNTTDAANGSCMLYYNIASNQINLLNDAGTAWMAATPGAAGAMQNSQCSVNVAAATAVLNGANLTLNLPMTFTAAYLGAKSIYMFASDVSGANSGWQQLGSWTVPGTGGTPAAVSATPNSGTGASQTFTLEYSDTSGEASLQVVYVWFNTLDASNNSCMLYYNIASNQIKLLNDAGTAWMAATPGGAGTLENSQCSLSLVSATVVPNGDTLTLSLPISFAAAFGGPKSIFMWASDISGSTSGWQQRGTWTVP